MAVIRPKLETALASSGSSSSLRSGSLVARWARHLRITSTRSLASLSPLLAARSALGRAVLQRLDVRQHQLDFDRLDVRDRIDRAGDVDHVGIFETADDLQDGVDLANVTEELVAQPLTFAGPFDDAGDIHQLDDRGDELLGHDVLADPSQPVVGHAHDPLVGLDRAERIIRTLGRLGSL